MTQKPNLLPNEVIRVENKLDARSVTGNTDTYVVVSISEKSLSEDLKLMGKQKSIQG